MKRIAIVDYGMGNLRSVQKAFEYIGLNAVLTQKPKDVEEAAAAVLPGVGAFADAMAALTATGMDDCIRAFTASGRPFLGICLGMQMLFGKSLEGGEFTGLGLLTGQVTPIPPRRKVPHMGWNQLVITRDTPLLAGLPQESFVYFVHSFYAEAPADVVTAVCNYGIPIPAAVGRDNIMATQFHPEKSGDVGLQILRNFGGLL
ncbi:MAG: imidazole glycerol phosphate synthase subunit HisH [Eubacteriales bacterium]|nr:imidazole glycerol phosphate synthase subunit HisH [Eubacteriales bacterium]